MANTFEFKKIPDRVVALVLVVVLAPALLLIAALVLSDGGPLFVSEARIGPADRRFRRLAFRSTTAGAGFDDHPVVTDHDSLTPVGRRLRYFSLENLPQLFNVIGGSMSLSSTTVE